MTTRAPRAIRHIWKVELAWGALTLAVGVLMLAKPATSIMVAGALLAAYLVISGIAQLVTGVVLDTSAMSRVPLFVTGALSLGLGGLAFRHFGYAYAVLLLAVSIGVVLTFEGVSGIALALEDRSLPDRGWYIFVGTMSVIAGIVMLAWPFRSLAAATAVAGIWLVAIGAGDVLWALRARRTFRDVRRTAERLTGSPAGPPAQRSSARDITTR